VHEFLVKPVSAKALHERLASVLLHPRPMVRRGEHYGPAPRKMRRRVANFPSPERPPEPAMQAERKPAVDRTAANVIVGD
jgi:two-component system, chemotaxis family, chemotaxis protein CheY